MTNEVTRVAADEPLGHTQLEFGDLAVVREAPNDPGVVGELMLVTDEDMIASLHDGVAYADHFVETWRFERLRKGETVTIKVGGGE